MREIVEDTRCCCVLIEAGEELPCPTFTSGPDDPFCNVCVGRHHSEAKVLSGYTIVTQRLPEVAS